LQANTNEKNGSFLGLVRQWHIASFFRWRAGGCQTTSDATVSLGHDPGNRPINLTVRYVSFSGIDMDTTVTVKIELELAYQLDMLSDPKQTSWRYHLKSDIGLSASAWVYGQRGWTNRTVGNQGNVSYIAT